MGSIGGNKKAYEDYDTRVTDTLIVEQQDGTYKIEHYEGQDLDIYEHAAELNHSKLLEYKYGESFFMKGITLDDVYRYLIDQFNLKGVTRR